MLENVAGKVMSIFETFQALWYPKKLLYSWARSKKGIKPQQFKENKGLWRYLSLNLWIGPKSILTRTIESSKKKDRSLESEKSVTQLQDDSDQEGSEEHPLILEDPVTENFSLPSTATTEFFQRLMVSGSKRKLRSLAPTYWC